MLILRLKAKRIETKSGFSIARALYGRVKLNIPGGVAGERILITNNKGYLSQIIVDVQDGLLYNSTFI